MVLGEIANYGYILSQHYILIFMEKLISFIAGAAIALFIVSFSYVNDKKRLRIAAIIVFLVSVVLSMLTGQGFMDGFKAGVEAVR